MAQRPHALVGEAVVVALLLLGGEPDAAQRVVVAPGGTPTRSCRSTTSRSALPLPCAIQVPEQARITGSTAVTSPLAGRLTMIAVWAAARGCRARGWRPRSPGRRCSCVRSSARRRSGFHSASGPCARRNSSSRSRRRARSSAASGASLRRGSSGRSRPSPRSRPRTPDDPAAPAELRDDHGDQRDDQAEPGDEEDQVAPRVLAAPVDEAQVVQQHQPGHAPGVARYGRVHADVHRHRRAGPGAARAPRRLRASASSGSRKAGAVAQQACRRASTGRWRPAARRAPRDRTAPAGGPARADGVVDRDRTGHWSPACRGCSGRGRTSAASGGPSPATRE